MCLLFQAVFLSLNSTLNSLLFVIADGSMDGTKVGEGMVGASGQSCSSNPSGTQWVIPSHLNFKGIDQNWHWNWLSIVGINDVDTFAVDVEIDDVSGVDISICC